MYCHTSQILRSNSDRSITRETTEIELRFLVLLLVHCECRCCGFAASPVNRFAISTLVSHWRPLNHDEQLRQIIQPLVRREAIGVDALVIQLRLGILSGASLMLFSAPDPVALD